LFPHPLQKILAHPVVTSKKQIFFQSHILQEFYAVPAFITNAKQVLKHFHCSNSLGQIADIKTRTLFVTAEVDSLTSKHERFL